MRSGRRNTLGILAGLSFAMTGLGLGETNWPQFRGPLATGKVIREIFLRGERFLCSIGAGP